MCQNRHRFVTALELAYAMIVFSKHPAQAREVFHVVMGHFSGPLYCNFPYFHYYPRGRTRWRNLTRREALLHRAIRNQKTEVVNHFLKDGADWEMANTEW